MTWCGHVRLAIERIPIAHGQMTAKRAHSQDHQRMPEIRNELGRSSVDRFLSQEWTINMGTNGRAWVLWCVLRVSGWRLLEQASCLSYTTACAVIWLRLRK